MLNYDLHLLRMLNYDQLKERPRDFLAATGLTQDEFNNLLPAFQTAYETRYPPHLIVEGSARQRPARGRAKGGWRIWKTNCYLSQCTRRRTRYQMLQALQFGLS